MDAVTTRLRWTIPALATRVVRYADLKPCYNAFIDTRSPGSEAKENFTIIGPGVSENSEQHVHIAEPHGFNIGGARQPPDCINSQHSHDTAEVFVVHSGTWSFNLGERGDEVRVTCRPGDTISLPTGMFRGFTNIGDDSGFLWEVLGGDNPGRVTWAPAVFDMAADYGLVLLESGSLVDTAAGQSVPAGERPMPRTTPAQAAALRLPTAAEAETLVVRAVLDSAAVIGPDAPLAWPHGFTVDRIMVDGDGDRDLDLAGSVIFIHRGHLTIDVAEGQIGLAEGDTMTVPADVGEHAVRGAAATVFRVLRECTPTSATGAKVGIRSTCPTL